MVIISDCLYTNWVEDSVAPLALTLNAALGADADRAARQKQGGPRGPGGVGGRSVECGKLNAVVIHFSQLAHCGSYGK